MIDFQKLRAPFPPDRVSWRVGPTNRDKSKGMALCYIDARDVQDRLDEVCGPQNWQCRYPHANGKTVCEIGVNVVGGVKAQAGASGAVTIVESWVWKSDGAGDTDMEAEKGALSDAFKRAAVRWGVGRYLYDMDSPWVKITEQKQIDPSELPRLRALLEGKKAPEKPEPAGDGGLPLLYPGDAIGPIAPSMTRWLTLYEEAAKEYGHLAMFEANDGVLAGIQAKAVIAGKTDLVDRIKRLYDAAHQERKVA